MKKFKDLENKKKRTYWKGRDVTKMNRIIDIQDPDTGYELVKKSFKRTMSQTDLNPKIDGDGIKQPKID